MQTVTKMERVANISISLEDYDILCRISEDYGISVDELAHEFLCHGLKFSSFRQYANPQAAIIQKRCADVMNKLLNNPDKLLAWYREQEKRNSDGC